MMTEKFDTCPVCDKALSQGEYDLQTCGTHFVAGKIRNHRKMSPVLPGERNIYESARDPKQGLIVRGVGRMADEPRALLVLLNERPTDDELRSIHEFLKGWELEPEPNFPFSGSF